MDQNELDTRLRPDDKEPRRQLKPLVEPYLRSDLVDHVSAALDEMRRVVEENGLELDGALFFDSNGDAGLRELSMQLSRTGARAVIVPSEKHLTDTERQRLRAAGVNVWVATTPPTCWPGHRAPDDVNLRIDGVQPNPQSTSEAQRAVDQRIAIYRKSTVAPAADLPAQAEGRR